MADNKPANSNKSGGQRDSGDQIKIDQISGGTVAVGRNATAIGSLTVELGPEELEELADQLFKKLGLDTQVLPKPSDRLPSKEEDQQIQEVIAAQRKTAAQGVRTSPEASYRLGLLAAYRGDNDTANSYFQEAENAIWQTWIDYSTLATKGQLRLVQQNSPESDLLMALLYLRSAVARKMSVAPWLERLDTPQSRKLLRRIEEISTENGDQNDEQSSSQLAERLLGILDSATPQRPQRFSEGPITWSAARAGNEVVRETAILALMIAYAVDEEDNGQKQEDALDRVNALWQATIIDRGRMAELCGILSGASKQIADRIKNQSRSERFAIWNWRFRRLFRRERYYILSLTAGGAVGAGLGLGILRAFLALFTSLFSGTTLFIYFMYGLFLGGALAFGVLLTNIVRLKPHDPEGEGIEKRPLLPALTMGALSFTFMHILLGIFSGVGLIRAAPAHLISLVAGASLALVIYDQPQAGWRNRAGHWLLRLSIVAVVFALIPTIFILYDDQTFTLLFFWSGYFYKSQLGDLFQYSGFSSILDIDQWFHYFAILDAALAGIAMALGLAAGILLAARWFSNWYALKVRAGE